MKKIVLLSLMIALSSLMTVRSQKRVPSTLQKWQSSATLDWTSINFRFMGVRGEDWVDKFPTLAETVDRQKADAVWANVLKARAAFHQDNLWILTTGNDSLAAAMIDVEWAFDAVFFACFAHVPGSPQRSLQNPVKGQNDDSSIANAYNKSVAPKVKKLLSVRGCDIDKESDGFRFAEAVKKWTAYNTVRWNDSANQAAKACPDKYLKRMGKGHRRDEVIAEWNKVQNSILDFQARTQWVREKNNEKLNKALADFEKSLLSYFEKYAKSEFSVESNKQVYSEVVPIAVDVLCMDYVSAVRSDKK